MGCGWRRSSRGSCFAWEIKPRIRQCLTLLYCGLSRVNPHPTCPHAIIYSFLHAKRGRGEHLFWIHTQSPPKGYGRGEHLSGLTHYSHSIPTTCFGLSESSWTFWRRAQRTNPTPDTRKKRSVVRPSASRFVGARSRERRDDVDDQGESHRSLDESRYGSISGCCPAGC